ncbi:Uncharacterised protein [Legionella cherrii]|uniref:Uncharacterized protein n=1 Tax=Legionella cherrii TaxID=28084 RepID=A0ABY6T4C5_9GAMM|nr:Uncharacterised protein [Legionella cherrii]
MKMQMVKTARYYMEKETFYFVFLWLKYHLF